MNNPTMITRMREEWLKAAPAGATRFTFPGKPEQVGNVRRLVEKLFTGTGREDDAALIVDELANNAILYTKSGSHQGWFGVELSFGTYARIAVADLGGAGWLIGADRTSACVCSDPDNQEAPDLEEVAIGGRGLVIVTKLAVATGACGSDDLGHLVWADLDIDRPTHLNPPLPLVS